MAVALTFYYVVAPKLLYLGGSPASWAVTGWLFGGAACLGGFAGWSYQRYDVVGPAVALAIVAVVLAIPTIEIRTGVAASGSFAPLDWFLLLWPAVILAMAVLGGVELLGVRYLRAE